MAKTKPYRSPLAPELADEILGIPLPEGFAEGRTPIDDPKTIGENLDQALARLHEAVELANESLGSNQMVRIVAESLARTLKKRGTASILVEPQGSVVLLVNYPQGEAVGARKIKSPSPLVKGKWHSDLPKLDELREDAEALGVDISDLGRARRAIHERILEARSKLRHMDEVRVSPLRATGPTNGQGHAEGPVKAAEADPLPRVETGGPTGS